MSCLLFAELEDHDGPPGTDASSEGDDGSLDAGVVDDATPSAFSYELAWTVAFAREGGSQ